MRTFASGSRRPQPSPMVLGVPVRGFSLWVCSDLLGRSQTGVHACLRHSNIPAHQSRVRAEITKANNLAFVRSNARSLWRGLDTPGFHPRTSSRFIGHFLSLELHLCGLMTQFLTWSPQFHVFAIGLLDRGIKLTFNSGRSRIAQLWL